MKIICALALSLSGHDRGKIFAVCREEEDVCFLVDGKGRTLERPKKKNRAHVQIIRHVPKELAQTIAEVKNDSDIVHLLRQYRKLQSEKSSKGANTVQRANTVQTADTV